MKMSIKKLIASVNAQNKDIKKVKDICIKYANNDADEIYIYNFSDDEKEKEELLSLAREISKVIDTPFMLGMRINRLEDIKKILYTGAKYALIDLNVQDDINIIKEGSERFGKEKIIVKPTDTKKEHIDKIKELGASKIIIDEENVDTYKADMPIYVVSDLKENDEVSLLSKDNVEGIITQIYEDKSIISVKKSLKEKNIDVKVFESKLDFSEFKLNSDGLLPVIVQDYASQEVLMMAYMNEEAFNNTLETGCMTYYSRSRKEQWVKGETSSHYQYVKELSIDCDKDTLLAKVKQVGAACHTGNRSCFYTELAKKDYDDTNPYKVLGDVFEVILDRKKNPKKGSYTNYLFDKGIDKILKKCGEEATEIVIAAKNPDKEEIKYEISDFLYHMLVLMAEKGITLEDITAELAHRK